MFAKFKMSQKMAGGFIVVALILGGVIIYQMNVMKHLAELEHEVSGRAEAVIEIGHITAALDGSYSVIADAIINRNLDESKKDFIELKSQSEKDIARTLELVDTEQEIADAREFADQYRKYLSIFEDAILPILVNAEAAQSETVDMAKIRKLDGEISEHIEHADEMLEDIVLLLHNEMVEAEHLFETTKERASLVSTIIAAFGTIIALLIAFCLTTSIAKPINETVKNMTSGSEQVSAAAAQVSAASQSLAEGASEQAAALEETSASMEEMTSMTKQNADNASHADNLMRDTLSVISIADQSMEEMSISMEEIFDTSKETSKIVKTIDEIAFQTNLLALNAAVEAARAGEAGAGFAVVADEVRNLAMRAAEAAKNTAELIEGTVAKVTAGKEIVNKTNSAFKEVAESSTKVGGLVGEISAASKEQATGFSQITQAIAQMDAVTQQNSAAAEESAAASEELNAQADTMMGVVTGLRSLVEGAKKPHRELPTQQNFSRMPNSPVSQPVLANTTVWSGVTSNNPEEFIPLDDDDEFENFGPLRASPASS